MSRAVELICEGQVYVPPFLPDGVTSATLEEWSECPFCSEARVITATEQTALCETGKTPPAAWPRALQCSPRQREIIDLLIAGQSNKGMARALNLSEGTIKFHMSAVMRLLGAHSRVEAATRAMKQLAA